MDILTKNMGILRETETIRSNSEISKEAQQAWNEQMKKADRLDDIAYEAMQKYNSPKLLPIESIGATTKSIARF